MVIKMFQVEEVQSVYLSLLESYIYSNRDKPAIALGSQLGLLTDLR